jgi:hypothetical protein
MDDACEPDHRIRIDGPDGLREHATSRRDAERAPVIAVRWSDPSGRANHRAHPERGVTQQPPLNVVLPRRVMREPLL